MTLMMFSSFRTITNNLFFVPSSPPANFISFSIYQGQGTNRRIEIMIEDIAYYAVYTLPVVVTIGVMTLLAFTATAPIPLLNRQREKNTDNAAHPDGPAFIYSCHRTWTARGQCIPEIPKGGPKGQVVKSTLPLAILCFNNGSSLPDTAQITGIVSPDVSTASWSSPVLK